MADVYTMTPEGLKKEFYTVKPNGIHSTVDEFSVMPELQNTRNIAGFDQFLLTSQKIDEEAKDHRVLGSEIEPMVDEDGLIKIRLGGKDGDYYNITDWSLNQLSQKLGVPSGYAVKMAEANKRELFILNFKSWIDTHHAGKYFLVRTHGNTVRGFLSDSYYPTDTNRILPIMQKGLESTNMDFRVHKGIINPEYTNIRIVSDRVIHVGDDPHFMGVSMSTSDVGRASMKMEFFVYRSACTNGMLFGKHGGVLFRKKHTSRHMTDSSIFEAEVASGLHGLDGLADYTENLLKDANRYTLKDDEMNRIIGEYKAFTGAGDKEIKTVEETIKDFLPRYNNVDKTLWSVSNAFTEMAQLVPLDKGEMMENFAGHLLHKRLAM